PAALGTGAAIERAAPRSRTAPEPTGSDGLSRAWLTCRGVARWAIPGYLRSATPADRKRALRRAHRPGFWVRALFFRSAAASARRAAADHLSRAGSRHQ